MRILVDRYHPVISVISKPRYHAQAAKIGLIQALISDYERDKLRMNSDTILRFSGALEVSTDELLRPAKRPAAGRKSSRKVLRRLELIESLPNHQQQTVLKTIDAMLRGLKTAS